MTSMIGAKINAADPTAASLPEPTGKYGVGTISLPLADTSRSGSSYADGTKVPYRELMIQIWYPAKQGKSGSTQCYTDAKTVEYINSQCPGIDFSRIKTNSVTNVEVEDCSCPRPSEAHTKTTPRSLRPKRYPVLVFSPGYGGMYATYQNLFEELASHGYIVVGVNHPGISGITMMPNGKYYSLLRSDTIDEEAQFKIVVADLQFVARQLRQIDYNQKLPVSGHLDMQNLGVLGHSFGGAAAVQVCIERPEYKAALNLDGRLYGEGYKNTIYKPVAFLQSQTSANATGILAENLKIFWNNVALGYKVKIAGTCHYSFTDLPSLAPQCELLSSSTIAPAQIIKITRDSVRAFFDLQLKQQGPKQMLNLAQKYPEITFEEHQR